MELILELCDDAKVSSTATKSPEQIWMNIRAGRHQLTVGGHDVRRNEIVASHACHAFGLEAKTSAESKAGNASG